MIKDCSGHVCHETDFVNEYDGEIDYTVPDGEYLVGAFSIHDNGAE